MGAAGTASRSLPSAIHQDHHCTHVGEADRDTGPPPVRFAAPREHETIGAVRSEKLIESRVTIDSVMLDSCHSIIHARSVDMPKAELREQPNLDEVNRLIRGEQLGSEAVSKTVDVEYALAALRAENTRLRETIKANRNTGATSRDTSKRV